MQCRGFRSGGRSGDGIAASPVDGAGADRSASARSASAADDDAALAGRLAPKRAVGRGEAHRCAEPVPLGCALLEDCVACAVDSLIGPFRLGVTKTFVALRVEVRSELPDRTRSVCELVLRICERRWRRAGAFRSVVPRAAAGPDRYQGSLSRLVPVGFVSSAGWDRLRDVERYVRALGVRLTRLPERPANDAAAMATMRRLEDELAARRVAPQRQSSGARGCSRSCA